MSAINRSPFSTKRAVIAFLTMFVSFEVAHAGMMFLDENAWEAAGGTPDLFDDFNDIAVDIPAGTLVIRPWGTIDSSPSPGGNSIADVPPIFPNFGDVNVNDSPQIDLYPGLDTFFGNGPIVFTFDEPIVSFGFDTNPFGVDIGQPYTVTTDADIINAIIPGPDVTKFLGYTFDSPTLTVTFDAPNDYAWFGLDNLRASTLNVPEPSTISMLALVLTGGVFVRRRQLV